MRQSIFFLVLVTLLVFNAPPQLVAQPNYSWRVPGVANFRDSLFWKYKPDDKNLRTTGLDFDATPTFYSPVKTDLDVLLVWKDINGSKSMMNNEKQLGQSRNGLYESNVVQIWGITSVHTHYRSEHLHGENFYIPIKKNLVLVACFGHYSMVRPPDTKLLQDEFFKSLQCE